jgi:hypothetical protein
MKPRFNNPLAAAAAHAQGANGRANAATGAPG